MCKWSCDTVGIELKEFVKDEEFIRKMNKAFADLRADYELSLDVTKEKIQELKQVHVDHKNFLANLVSFSVKSSGILSGLRGTGKTHLFLLARDEINQKIYEEKALCVYINVKRLHLPEEFNQELFNRVFSVFLYEEISKQLFLLLKDICEDSYYKKFLLLFKKDEKTLYNNISKALVKLLSFKVIAQQGNHFYEGLEKGTFSKEAFEKEIIRLQSELSGKIGEKNIEVSSKISSEMLDEVSQKICTNNAYLKYLNIYSVREQLIELLGLLNLKSITFFVDEWEKLYYNQKSQEFLSFYIDRIIDNPLYFWLGVVPYRGQLFHLDNGADLQHYFNLDEALIYENSKIDKELCMAYFKEFINKRLYYYFNDVEYNYHLLFDNDKKLELLVLASMGNSRDFGTMLLDCWSEYQSYRSSSLNPGRPYKYINNNMIIKSIKNNGDKKFINIKNEANLMSVWKDIENFCLTKSYSHFAIEESKENMEAVSTTEISELIYHRLLHFRKGHVPPKETKIRYKLSIYALNYAGIYDLHAKDRSINYVTDYDTIHDRVRRYLYDPKPVIQRLRLRSGEIVKCGSCDEEIDIYKMKGAWEMNFCPFCTGKIRKEST